VTGAPELHVLCVPIDAEALVGSGADSAGPTSQSGDACLPITLRNRRDPSLTLSSGQICYSLSEFSAQKSRICAGSAHLQRTVRIKIRILQVV
jgi:hypothetical protein